MQNVSLERWRTFGSARYRPFQAIAVGQAFTMSFASDALFVPLLLRLGTPVSLVVIVGSIPLGASAVQALWPQVLLRMRGNLRRLTLLLTLAELRGFIHAAIVAGVASGVIDSAAGILLISLTVAIAQTGGVLSASNISLWTAVVLPDPERRLVGPRMGAATMALATVLLLPAGAVLDAGLRSFGLWAYSWFFLAGGVASMLTPLAVARLPHPGRVLVRTGDQTSAPLPEPFRRFTGAMAIAMVGQGFIPYLSLYAITVLGASAGFAVALSGSASAGALLGSLAAGTFLLRGSSSRVLRASLYSRSLAACMCAAAMPGNPVALPLLVLGTALFSGGGNAGVLASNERLYRLAPPELRVHCQSHYVAVTSAAFAAGAAVCGSGLLLAGPVGWGVFTTLYLASGVARLVAATRTDVSPTWVSPSAPTIEELA